MLLFFVFWVVAFWGVCVFYESDFSPDRLLRGTGGQLGGGGGKDKMGAVSQVAALGVKCIVWWQKPAWR